MKLVDEGAFRAHDGGPRPAGIGPLPRTAAADDGSPYNDYAMGIAFNNGFRPAPLLARTAPLILLLALCAAAQQRPAKRPLTHKDADSWRAIRGQVVSPDGRFVAYGLFPQEGDGEVIVRDAATGKDWREPAGEQPPPPDIDPATVAPGEEPRVPSTRCAFTSDSRHVACTTFAAKADVTRAKKEKKKPEDAQKGGLVIWNLGSGTARRIEGVKSFQVPENGGPWIAWLKEPRPPAPEAQNEAEAKKKEAGSPAQEKKEYGSDLVLRDLAAAGNDEGVFPDVVEYSFGKDGKTLVYAVSSRKEEDNGVYAVTPASGSAPAAILQGKGKYSKLTWDEGQTQLAFLSDRDDTASKQPKLRIYLWDRKSATATEIVSTATKGFETSYVISGRGALSFSRDGNRLFFGCSPPEPPKEEASDAGEESVVADLWHWKDPYVQPMQRIRAAQERARSYRAVYHIAEKKLVQLAGPDMAEITPSDDGRFAIGMDDRAYRPMVDYDGRYADWYTVDTVTGARRMLLRQMSGSSVSWSPGNRHVAFYKDKHWHVVQVPDGSPVTLTANLGVEFSNEEHDLPGPPMQYGSAGWTSDGTSFLVYDRYDVWQLPVDGQRARCITGGLGRKEHIRFRVVQLDPEEARERRGIDPAQPLFLRAENLETRDSGFWRVSMNPDTAPQKFLMTPRSHPFAIKARRSNAVLLTASTFAEPPELHLTDTSFAKLRKITDSNPQKAQLLWGTAELVPFRSADGVPLKAVLYKPEGLAQGRKYPLLVYIYERLSDSLHNFVPPRPGTSINISYYVSNGYLVLTPDIAYSVGSPGESALKCVLPAIQAVVDRGIVDENAIGIQGHSWGGYQIAYMLTRTRRFRAAEAGAPVANMTSAYNGIRWGSGQPRQFQYEKAQSRIGGTLWEAPLRFIENSALFAADRITTPLLILHNDQDDAVPWYQGIELYLSLRRLRKEVYLFNYNGEKHGLRKRVNQKDYTTRMQQFFDHFLKGAPKPSWMEAGIPFLEREKEKESFKTLSGNP